jgi:hypothetical protein
MGSEYVIRSAAPSPGAPTPPLTLTPDEHAALEPWARRRQTAQAVTLRARMMPRGAEGLSHRAVAAERGEGSRPRVGQWRPRLIPDRLRGLTAAPRAGAPRRLPDAPGEAILTKTLEETPPGPPLVPARDGPPAGEVPDGREPPWAGLRAPTPLAHGLPALAGPGLWGDRPRGRRAVSGSPRAGRGPGCRREAPDPRPKSAATPLAAAPRASSTALSR